MHRPLGIAFGVILAASGCLGDSEFHDEEVGAAEWGLPKGMGGTNGDFDYCSNPALPCVAGEGDCDGTAECAVGLVCTPNAGPRYGLSSHTDVCEGATCSNSIWDANECGVDCGGTSGCAVCTRPPSKDCGGTLGDAYYCDNPHAVCASGEGNCSNNTECEAGLVCTTGAGPKFGFASNTAVCLPSQCSNRVRDANEAGVDCGGTSGCGDCPVAAGGWIWDDPSGDGLEDLARAVASDASGNVYVVGYFQGNIDFGAGALTSAGARDVFVASYTTSGALRWANRYGSAGDQLALGVAVDSANAVILTGYFTGSIDFGGGALTSPGAGQQAIFLAKLDSSGTHIWSTSYGDATNNQQGWAIAAHGSDIALVGYYRSTVDFGGGALPAASDWRVFVARFNGSGVHQWSAGYGTGSVRAHARSVSFDSLGNVAIGGQFRNGSLEFGAATLTNPSATEYDGFVAVLDPAGAPVWSARYGDATNQHVRRVAFDSADRLVVLGYAQGSTDVGCGTRTSAGGHDLFVAQLVGATGACNWHNIYGDIGEQYGDALAIDSSDAVIVGGDFERVLTFPCRQIRSDGLRDGFVAKLSSAGTCIWTRRFGAAGTQRTHDVATSGTRVFAVGGFEQVADLGGGARTSSGNFDAFVARYAP